MGKQGPCYHCGVTTTPLWRNGPPDKPVLCNACGSRWRTKGSLTNYTPLHARGETNEHERVSRMRNLPIVKNKEPPKVKGLQKVKDEEISNRSSSGSAMSNSDGCVRFENEDTSEFTDPSQSIVWDSTVPSKNRKPIDLPKKPHSSLDHLTKDLYAIYHQQQQSSQHSYSISCDDDLLFESDTSMVSVEIGHGSVLIRHPLKEEESVASSSISVENNKVNNNNKVNEAYSRLNKHGADVAGVQLELLKREKTQRENLQILGNPYSLLCCIDLKEILNFVEFERHVTVEEQQKLLKYLPFIDTAKQPDSLKDLFGSLQFKENTSSFQKLLAEGVFDLSCTGMKAEDCKVLRKLVLGNPIKSKWVEQYNLLKEMKCRNYNEGSLVEEEPKSVASSAYSANLKRPRDSQFQKLPGASLTTKSPKRSLKSTYGQIDNNSYRFSPKNLFISENSDQDLLLEVPSNNSFPEAELLIPSTGNSFFR